MAVLIRRATRWPCWRRRRPPRGHRRPHRHTPALGTDTPATIERRRGGSAANVAAAAATAGCPPRFIGWVGADETGARLAGELEAARASTSGCSDVGAPVPWSSSSDPTASGRCCPTAPRPRQLADGRQCVARRRDDGCTSRRTRCCAEPIGAAAGDDRHVPRPRRARLSVDVSSVAVVEAYGVGRFAGLLSGLAPDVVFANVAEAALVDGRATGPAGRQGRRPARSSCAVPTAAWPIGAVRRWTTSSTRPGPGDAFAGGYLAACWGCGARGRRRRRRGVAARTLTVAGARWRRGNDGGAGRGSTRHGPRHRPRVRRHPAPGGADVAEARRSAAAVEHRLPRRRRTGSSASR